MGHPHRSHISAEAGMEQGSGQSMERQAVKNKHKHIIHYDIIKRWGGMEKSYKGEPAMAYLHEAKDQRK